MADNPVGKTVELSVAQRAFSGYVSNVTVQNLIIEKYAAPLFSGAVAPSGPNWTIKSNEVRLNHGAGIKTQFNKGDYAQIISNNVHHNGQEGIGVGGGTGVLVEFNISASNNFANCVLECGGGKISGTVNARVIMNHYSQNNGPGIWVNGGATGGVISDNTVTESLDDGIRIEISHYATVSGNTLVDNGQSLTGVCTPNTHEIVLASSDNSTISGNTLLSKCGAIWIASGARHPAINDSVLDNITTYAGLVPLPHPFGGMDSTGTLDMFDAASDNFYDYNTYHLPLSLLLQDNWYWDNLHKDWSQWKAAGEDTHGLAD
jgi:parallel beta-helix repeat protein